MKKNQIVLSLFFTSCFFLIFPSASAKLSEIPLAMIQPYKVKSDAYNSEVPKGHFALKGKVAFSSGQSEQGQHTAFISNYAQDNVVWSDTSGNFYGVFSMSDTLIYCAASGFSEVVFPGPFTERHLIEVDFYLAGAQDVFLKPVIYAYSSSGNFSMSLKPAGEFTFTYPQSADGIWNMRTNEDGTLTNLDDQKNYPYIFWEGEGPEQNIIQNGNQVSGYLIKTDTCISFLENTLMAYGLNEKESTDFITFWGPKMIEKPYAFVQFLTNAEYEKM